jgi:hypothetical protein
MRLGRYGDAYIGIEAHEFLDEAFAVDIAQRRFRLWFFGALEARRSVVFGGGWARRRWLERRTVKLRTEAWDSSRHQRTAAVAKGVDIEIAPLDEEHVRAKITWSEQDAGGGKLIVEVTVKNMKSHPKTDAQVRSDARALAVRFARAFADTIED